MSHELDGYADRIAAKMPGEQGSTEWLYERVGNATGSKFANIMATRKDKKEAAPRYNYKMELVVERITGKPTETFVSQFMLWGTEQEPAARMAYEQRTGAMVAQTGYRSHPTIARCGGSVDGLVDDDGIIEIKCPTTFNHLETMLADNMPEEHAAQVQGYLWIHDRQWCDFISYDPRLPRGLDLFVKRIYRDDDYIAELSANVVIFLREVEEMHMKLMLRVPVVSAGPSNDIPPLEL